MSQQPKEITYSQVIALLDEGKTRKEIRTILGITHQDLKMLFDRPELKNRRRRKPERERFIFIMDAPVEGELLPNSDATMEESRISFSNDEEPYNPDAEELLEVPFEANVEEDANFAEEIEVSLAQEEPTIAEIENDIDTFNLDDDDF